MPSANSGITFLRSWSDPWELANPDCVNAGVGGNVTFSARKEHPNPSTIPEPETPRERTPWCQSLGRCKRNTGGSYVWFWELGRFSFKMFV